MTHTSDDDLALYTALQQIYVLLDDGDRRAFDALELTPTQYNLLLRLSTTPGGGPTISELSRALLCTRGNVTRLVQRLAARGLVQCSGDPADQRLVRVALTPAGERLRATAQRLHRDSLRRRFGQLDPAEQASLRRLSERLARLLEADLRPAEEDTSLL